MHEYYILGQFSILNIRGVKRLVKKAGPEITKFKYYAFNEEIYDIVHAAHKSVGHGGIHKTFEVVNDVYENISRTILQLFIELCVGCAQSKVKKGYKNS